MKTCTVIYNPNSGKSLKNKHLKTYKKILRSHGYTPRFIGTQYKGHAKEIVNHLDKCDLVISLGGDGTFNEIMGGNFERNDKLVLAHIPVGTTNDIGVMFGYGKKMKQNLKDLLNGVVRSMDICVINGRPFVYVAGFGKFMQIPYDTPRKLKKKYGYGAYLISGLKDFLKPTKLYEIEYQVNGKERTGYYSFMMISNATRVAGINNFYRDVKLDDDQFEVLFCRFKKRIDIIRTFTILMTAGVDKVPGIEFFKTNNLKLKFSEYPKNAWCIDGEKLDRAVLNYEIKNVRNVQIMLPKKNLDKIFINKKS